MPAKPLPLPHLHQPEQFAEALRGQMIKRADIWELLRISSATGERLVAAGKIGPRAVRLGGCLRYSLAEVLAWLDTRRQDGQLHDARTWPFIWESLQTKR